MVQTLSPDQVRRLRLRAQKLNRAVTPVTEPSVTGIVRTLVGVQAQEASAAALGVWVRGPSLTSLDLQHARAEDRTVVRTWCLRGTLHLVATEDLGWLLPLLGPTFARASRTRRLKLGLDDGTCTAGVRLLRDVLAMQGPLARAAIVERLAARGLPLVGQAGPHLLAYAALLGYICLGPDQKNTATYVLLDDWVKLGPPLPRDAALAELARRYLAAYGPAGPDDFATWSGLPTPEVRTAWQQVEPETMAAEVDGRPLRILASAPNQLDDLPPEQEPPLVRLLPAFDAWLLGYRHRDLVLDPQFARRVNAGGGILHPLLLVDGRVVGTWRGRERRDHLQVEVSPFESLSSDIWGLIEAEATSLARFRGQPEARMQVG